MRDIRFLFAVAVLTWILGLVTALSARAVAV